LGRARGLLLRQHADGHIDDVTLERDLRELASQRAEAGAALARPRERAMSRWSQDDLADAAGALREVMAACEPEDRLEIVRALIPGHAPYVITIHETGIEAVLRLDPEAWLCRSPTSSRRNSRTTYPPPLDIRLAC